MKKWTTRAAAVALAVTVAACGGGSDAAEDGPAGSPAASGGEPVQLTYAIWSTDQQPAMQQVVDAFEAENPDVDVEIQLTPWTEYWTKLQVSAGGGTAPDAFWMLGDRFQQYAAGGQLLELDDAIEEAGVDMSVYPQPLVDLFQYEGRQYGLPKDFDTIGLWYNRRLFDEAGVAYPDDTWTWEDVRTAARALTDPARGVFGIAAGNDRQANYYNTIFQAGGQVLQDDGTSGYDTPEVAEGIRFWTDLIADGSSPTLQQMSDTEPVEMFESGTIAMYYGGSFFANRFYANPDLKANADVTVLPEGRQRGVVINGIQNVGYAQTEHPQELADFLLFLGGERAAQIQAETGAVLPAYAGTQQAWVESMPEFDVQVFLDQVPDAVVFPVSANTAAWQDLETELLAPAWQLEQDPAEATQALAQAMDAELADE